MQTATPTESDPLPPAFTELDEQRELATTCPSEIAKAEADVRGITSSVATLGIKEEAERKLRLRQLDEELSKIPDDQQAAYLEAVERCPEMVNDEHRVAFLEREAYDAKLAAQRLVRYWETKLDVFGPERCFLPLTLEGAMKGEEEGMLKYCTTQVLPVRDTSGRAIIFSDPSRRDLSKYPARQAAMAFWYMAEAATEDHEVRKRGVVLLTSLKNLQRKHFDPASFRFHSSLLMDVLPVPVRSIHACHPNPFRYVLYQVGKYLIGKDLRLRIKLHCGSTEHVLQELGMYCLPRDRVPSELGGEVILDLEKWLYDRSEIESKRLTLQGQHSFDGKADTKARPAKRLRSEDLQRESDESNCLLFLNAAPSLPEAVTEPKSGRRADPRMNRAVEIKLSNPDKSAYDALIEGGFKFPSPDDCGGLTAESILDSDHISLKQRRNQLSRRIRQAKKRQSANACSTDVKRGSVDDIPEVVSSDIVLKPYQDVSSGLEKDMFHEIPEVDTKRISGAEKGRAFLEGAIHFMTASWSCLV